MHALVLLRDRAHGWGHDKLPWGGGPGGAGEENLPLGTWEGKGGCM